jgi:DNA-binding NarL/FixJ family response regulator
VVDAQPLYRAALRDLMKAAPDLNIVGEATEGHEALKLFRRLQPDLLITDVVMPNSDILSVIRTIKREQPYIKVMILTSLTEPTHLSEAIKAGADAYVLKDLTPERLINTVRRALTSDTPLNQELCMQLFRRLINEENLADPNALKVLTPREIEVLRLIGQGLTNQQIARQLLISASTAKKHIQHIIAKLGVSDRTQAAILAVKVGLR